MTLRVLAAFVAPALLMAAEANPSQAPSTAPTKAPTAVHSEVPDALKYWLEGGKLAVSFLGFGGTIAALLLAVGQYRRNQQWRRAEFIAGETKEFANNPTVRKTLQMIDWSTRRLNLSNGERSGDDTDLTIVTREVQWKALLPHTLKDGISPAPPSATHFAEEIKRKYTPTEALIRDCYDLFLDWLERFAAFIETGLISAEELRPHIDYWIDDIAMIEGDPDDARWRCTLLTYIRFYRFDGAERLFAAYGKDISQDGQLYRALELRMAMPELAQALRRAVNAEAQRGKSS